MSFFVYNNISSATLMNEALTKSSNLTDLIDFVNLKYSLSIISVFHLLIFSKFS